MTDSIKKEVVGDMSRDEAKDRVDKSLKHSVKDGAWWSVMMGTGESYLSAFALFLKATEAQLGLLMSLPQLISSMVQLLAVKLTNVFDSRKKIVVTFAFLQGLTWLFIIALSYVSQSVWVLILLASFYFAFGALAGPAWVSWMGDLVPEQMRGRYFGMRNRVSGFIAFLATIGGGLLLDYVSQIDTHMAFMIVFSIAFFGRMVSTYYLTRMFEPNVEIRAPRSYPISEFIKGMWTDRFGVFSLYTNLMLFAVYISAPFVTIIWLNYLGFSYFQYMIVLSASTVTSFITMTYWGTHADTYGNKTVLWVSSYLLAIVPFFLMTLAFLQNETAFWMSVFVQILAGFAWAGFNLSSSNFIFDLVLPEDRVRFMTYHNAFRGIGIFAGSMLGAGIAPIVITNELINPWVPSGIFITLFISGFLRFFLATIFIKRIAEIKIGVHRPRFLHFVTAMPVDGVLFDSVVGMNRTLKRFKEYLHKMESNLDSWEKYYREKKP